MTYKVLSIDLDYIMGPSIETYSGLMFDEHPMVRWSHLYKFTDFTEGMFHCNKDAILFCYERFMKAMKNCSNVSFGYEHDEILYQLRDKKDIDIINIDHHDDIFCYDFGDDVQGNNVELEYEALQTFGRVHEGNWGAWLHDQGILEKFTWITNSNSKNLNKNEYNEQLLGSKYETTTQDKFDGWDDYEDFDYIFVCLSPQYMPQSHWYYFTMFMMAYETFTGKKVDVDTFAKRKFMQENKFDLVTNEILYKRPNGR